MKTKIFTISMIAILVCGDLFAQRGDIVLGFSGKDALTNFPVPLQSVYVNNLTKGCDTTLFGESPFLYLTYSSGIHEFFDKNDGFYIEPNYPNPFTGSTRFNINIRNNENLRIILCDVYGKNISEFKAELTHGLHTFEATAGKSSILFLTVSNGESTRLLKLVSMVNTENVNPAIRYLGVEKMIDYKNAEEVNSFLFQPGDQLQMKASANGYYDNTLFDNPTETSAYIFEMQAVLPIVTTSVITDISSTSAACGGNVTFEGGTPVITRGICWSTLQNPTVQDSLTNDGSGSGIFTSSIAGLLPNTTYYVRAYATNQLGTAYGNEEVFTTLLYTIPVVTTFSVIEITTISAASGGNVTDDGGDAVTARGVCWSTSPGPTTASSHTSDGTGTGTYSSSIIGLTLNTTYYVRAYATNSQGTAYGNQVNFTTLNWQCGDNFIDPRDGQTYTTVQIGTQCWMAENLNIGTRINGGNNQTDNGIIEKYCYNNDEANCDVYGGLYQWDEMMQYTTVLGVQGICPPGWYLPSDEDWTAMTDYVSSQLEYLCNSNTTYIAKALAAKTNWTTSTNTCAIGNNLNANNATNFTALPGGYRYPNGAFYYISYFGSWWSSTEYSSASAWYRYMDYTNANVSRDDGSEGYGFSVRCLRD